MNRVEIFRPPLWAFRVCGLNPSFMRVFHLLVSLLGLMCSVRSCAIWCAVRGVVSVVGGVDWLKRYSQRGWAVHGVTDARFVADFWGARHHHLLKLRR